MRSPVWRSNMRQAISRLLFAAVYASAACVGQAQTVRYKANNTDNLNLASSWENGNIPAENHVAAWNNTVTGPNSVNLGADLRFLGIRMLDPGGNVTIGGANTLTTDMLGIDMNAATADLTLNNACLALKDYACVAWSVADGRTLTVNPAVFWRGERSALRLANMGTVASAAIANDATGIVGPWATIGSGTDVRYVTVSGGQLVGYTGTQVATASGVTDATGMANYEVAGAGTIPAGASFNTLRYTGPSSGNIVGSLTANGIMNAGAGALTFNSGAPANVLTIGPTRELVLATPDTTRIFAIYGPIADHASGASGVTLTGGGAVNMRGNNTYSGVTVVNSGILYPFHSNALGTTDGHTVIYSTGRPDGGRLIFPGPSAGQANGITIAEPITIAGSGDGSAGNWVNAIGSQAGTTNTLTGMITLTGMTTYRIGIDGSNTELTLGPIQRSTASAGNLYLFPASNSTIIANGLIDLNGGWLTVQTPGYTPGTVVLNAASNHVGTVQVHRNSLLKPTVPDALIKSNLGIGHTTAGNGSNTVKDDIGTVDLGGVSQTINSLIGYPNSGSNPSASDSRRITNSSDAPVTLTVGIGNGTGSFDGVIENGPGGSISLTKVGTGTQTLAGNRDNTYTGLTTVANGTLALNKTAGTNAVSGDIVIGAGALQNNQNEQIADTATVTMTAATSKWNLNVKSETVANVDIQNANNATSEGLVTGWGGEGGKLTVTDTLTHTLGNITLSSAGNGGETTITANRLVNLGGTWTFGSGSGTQSLRIGPGGLTIGGGSTIPVAASANSPNYIGLGGNVTSESVAEYGTEINTISGTGRLLLNGPREFAVNGGTVLAVSAAIADGTDTGSITKTGPGILALSGENTFTGGITVEAGALTIDRLASVPGWETPGLYTIASNATLAVGSGVADGDVPAIFASVSGSANFQDGATCGFDTTLATGGNRTYADNLADLPESALSLAKVGPFVLTLTGVNTYSGRTIIKDGALSIATTGALPGWNEPGRYEVWRDAGLAVYNVIGDSQVAAMLGTGNFLDGACIGFDTTSSSRTYSSVLGDTANGALGLYKVGINTLTLSGDNTYNGNTFVMRGVLSVAHSNALGTTEGYTAVYATGSPTNGGQLAIGPITIKENIVLAGPGDGNGGYSPALYGSGGVDGTITLASQGKRFRINATSGNLVLNGPVVLADGVTGCSISSEPQPNRELFVSNTVDVGTGDYTVLGYSSQGIVNICSTGNNWAYLHIYQSGTARLGVDDALPTNKEVRFGSTSGQIGTWDLAGYNQTVGGLLVNGTALTYRNNVISNSAPSRFSTLTVNQAAGATSTFPGRFVGAIHLVKAGAADSQLLLQEANELSGTVTVAGGKLVLDGDAGSLGASCTNVVVEAGTLTVRNSSAIANCADLSIAAGGGAKVELAAGVNEAVGHLYLGGEMKRVGTYGSTSSPATYKNDEYFSGTGVLTVLYDVSGTLIKIK